MHSSCFNFSSFTLIFQLEENQSLPVRVYANYERVCRLEWLPMDCGDLRRPRWWWYHIWLPKKVTITFPVINWLIVKDNWDIQLYMIRKLIDCTNISYYVKTKTASEKFRNWTTILQNWLQLKNSLLDKSPK